jgi:glycine cleavage system aminomethyltransferase T
MVRGRIEDTIAVYQALLAAGKPFGITELGRHAYRNAILRETLFLA